MARSSRVDPLRLGPFQAGDRAVCFCSTRITFVEAKLRGWTVKWWRGEDGSSHCYYEDQYVPMEGAWHQPFELAQAEGEE